MSFNVFPYLLTWTGLALAVIALAAYKGLLYLRATRAEFPPHLSMRPSEGARITAAAHREAVIDKWGKVLTMVTVVYGLAIAVAYIVNAGLRAR